MLQILSLWLCVIFPSQAANFKNEFFWEASSLQRTSSKCYNDVIRAPFSLAPGPSAALRGPGYFPNPEWCFSSWKFGWNYSLSFSIKLAFTLSLWLFQRNTAGKNSVSVRSRNFYTFIGTSSNPTTVGVPPLCSDSLIFWQYLSIATYPLPMLLGKHPVLASSSASIAWLHF